MKLHNLINNKILIYMVSRYIVYFIQFLTTLLIAAKLGPYYMGIWGFLLLLINYFSQLHFGIANSLNILMVHHKGNKMECDVYIANAIVLTMFMSFAVGLFYLYYRIWGIPLFDKYHINEFFIWICLIGVLQYFNMLAINVFRVKNMLNHVTFSQSIIILINFVGVILFDGRSLIIYLIVGYIVGNTLILFLSGISGCIPKVNNFIVSKSILSEIIKKGILLFLYNSCFYFIVLSIKTIVSRYYEVTEFGMFAFSFSLGQAVMLLIGAFSFIIFPKLIDSLSSPNLDEIKKTISTIRVGYITTAHFVVYTALIAFPFLLHYMPQYLGALKVLNLIALTTLLDANSFGFSTLLIARNKEKMSAIISIISLVLNISLGLILANVFHVEFSYVIFATMITYLFFCFAVMRKGSLLIGIKDWSYILKNVFPVKLFIPYFSAVTLSVISSSLMFVPLLLCVILNYKESKQIASLIKKLVYKPNVIDV